MDTQTLISTTDWREFNDRDALHDRLAAELIADNGDW